MSIQLEDRVSIPGEVMVSQLGGEAVLLNLQTESYFGLDEVGTVMWEAVRDSSNIQAAYERLLLEFEVDGQTLMADLREFLEQLAAHGLIELHPAAQ